MSVLESTASYFTKCISYRFRCGSRWVFNDVCYGCDASIPVDGTTELFG